jgi:hypothetical protein
MNIRITGGISDEQEKTVAIMDQYAQSIGGGDLKDRLDGKRAEDAIPMIRKLVEAAEKTSGGKTGEAAYEFRELLTLAEQNPTGVLEVL